MGMVIAKKIIRQQDGLYCLNDLHHAAGGDKRHQVTNWLNNQQTTEFIEYLSKPEISGLEQNQQLM